MADGTWTVTDDEPRSSVGGKGGPPGRRISYKTGNGATGYVEVALADYTPAKVTALIKAAVATHDLIAQGSAGTQSE